MGKKSNSCQLGPYKDEYQHRPEFLSFCYIVKTFSKGTGNVIS